ncbi:MAG: glutamyl-tRNA reductase [Bacteroidetes bacterium]|nr:glutamyl-tRNA reductase [Bacteroidota bacterium]
MQSKVHNSSVNRLYSVAFTHKNFPLDTLGLLHIEQEQYAVRLLVIKDIFSLSELFYLSTCNRVEFAFVSESNIPDLPEFTRTLLLQIFPEISKDSLNLLIQNATYHNGINVVEHLISVAASIDSMVVGEREIITQVRKAFELCQKTGLTGDKIRLVMRQVIETAKQVYSKTSISKKPVSIVSLAFKELKRFKIPMDARVLVIGAGSTSTTLCRFLKKHGFHHFFVFNRTFSRGAQLARELRGHAFKLEDLDNFGLGFDVLVTCTSADHHIINKNLYKSLLSGDETKKIIIDLAIPQDIDPDILDEFQIQYISIRDLQHLSNENLKTRQGELSRVRQIINQSIHDFEIIYKERHVEIVMHDVPVEVKKIREQALNKVFKKELERIDTESRELLEKIMEYMEKKYISGPMKKAKAILLSSVDSDED